MGTASLTTWICFNLFILAMLALDLGVFHRRAHVVSLREAATWTAVWIALALLFAGGIWHFLGPQKGMEFLTGYLIEKSLSVDNIFVFVVLFGYFAVPRAYQHRVLFWGILGALVLRAAFIFAGTALLTRFHWVIYLFGAFLVVTGVKMVLAPDRGLEPEKNPVLRLLRRLMPVSQGYHGQRFFVREGGRHLATPLLLVLVFVELCDLLFAVDSIPAIFAVTLDPFIVYTSNVFAILGLRALYFVLAGVMQECEYLKPGLAAVLVFVGVKMLVADLYKISAAVSLGVVAGILAVAVAASLVRSHYRHGNGAEPPGG
jgi:tellurite resistance protein TerC